MRKCFVGTYAAVALVLGSAAGVASAQSAVKLFGSTFIRQSQQGTTPTQPVTFNSATVSLSCDATSGAPTAVLSSTADGSGKVLVDNFINVSVETGSGTSTPVNVCRAGALEPGSPGTQNDCFNTTYQSAAPGMIGADLDGYTATGGVTAIDISGLLTAGQLKVKVDLVDTGYLLANASLYLVTSCTQGGVTGPAKITGNPISSSNPTPGQLNQDYDFNSAPGQLVGFTYDLTQSQKDGTLSITDQTIPTTSDVPLDPALWQSQYAMGTSFATSSCLVHTGELINGSPACKLYTLTCQVGSGVQAAGALCPRSQLSDEVFTDSFSGPGFDLPDIVGPNGKTYHQGVGFLMSAEGWTGGQCTFDSASGLQQLDCPQNLLTNLTMTSESAPLVQSLAPVRSARVVSLVRISSFSMNLDGTGTHPNSTFLSVAQVPEDLTTVTVQGAHAGGWVNSHTITLGLVSEPPVLPNTVPNYQNFVAAPIKSITYGLSPAGMVPPTKFAVPGDVTLTNPAGCPKPAPQAATFAPVSQTLPVTADGEYALHYFAQDCAGTQELKFVGDSASGWTSTFFTVPVNVDTVIPVVASGPTFSVAPSTIDGTANAFTLNQPVNVSYSCTDDRAGVATCGQASYGSPGTLNTGTLTYALDTSSVGQKTLTVEVTDAAGNVGTPVSVTYNVVAGGGADMAISQVAKVRAEEGSAVPYHILAVNRGPAAAENVVVTDVIPAGTTLVNASYSRVVCRSPGRCEEISEEARCSMMAGKAVCNVGEVKPNRGVEVIVVVKLKAVETHAVLVNTVSVRSTTSDPNPGNNTSIWKTTVR